MPENSTPKGDYYKPRVHDQEFWTVDTPTPASEEAPAPKATTPGGRFQKGPDPRRHTFTREECQRGFWSAIESIVSRNPEAIMRDGRHIACNFLQTRGAR